MSTAKSVGGNIKGLKDTIEVLKLAFPNLSSAIINVITALKSGEGAANAFKVSLSGIGSVIKAHPVIAAITAVVALASAISFANKKAEEARNAAIEAGQKTSDDSSQLSTLIDEYKEIAKQGIKDVESRNSVAKIQQQIVDLVGAQASNIDLVNGKLDSELEKLKDINKEVTDIATLQFAYENTKKKTDKKKNINVKSWDSMDMELGSEDIKIHGDQLPGDSDIKKHYLVKDIIEKAVGNKGSVDQISGDIFVNLAKLAEKDYKSRLEIYNQIIEELRKNGFNSDDEVFSQFLKQKNELQDLYDEQSKAANNLLSGLVQNSYFEQETDVSSLEEYLSLREKIINEIKTEDSVQDMLTDNSITKDDIENKVDSYLGGLNEYSEYYKKWYEDFGSDVAKITDKVKSTLLSNNVFNIANSQEEYDKKSTVAKDIEDWFNELTDRDREIIVKIKAEYGDDTDDWSLEKWKNALTNWEIPEEEKFHFSDLFADEDFKTKVDDYKDKITELDNALKDLQNKNTSESDKNKLFLNLSDKFPELTGQADNLEESISNLIESLESDAIEYFNEQLEHMATEEDVASINNLKNTLLGLATTAHGVENIKDKIDELKTSLGNLKSTYDSIKSVISDYNNNGYLTLDNLQSIMSLEPEYINLLINENGQINLNSQAYKNYVTSKAKSLLVNELKDLYGTVLNMKQEEAQAYANAKAYDEETRSVKDLLTATTQLYIDKARAKDSVNGNTTYMDALTRSFGTAANYAAMVDDYINSLSSTQNEFSNVVDSTTSALDGEKESLEANKKALEDEKNALEDTKKSLEDYKNELSDAQNNLKDFIDLVTDYIKQIKDDEKSALKDQIEALNKQKEALDESKNKYADVIDKKKEALKLAKEEKEAAEELANKQKSVAKDRLALEVAGLDDSSAGKKAQKQAKDNLATSEKDLSNYLSDQSYEKQVAELEDLQKKFEESIEKRKVAIDNQVEYINSKIDEIDKYLDNSRRLYEDACNMIDNDNGTLYANLWNYTYTYTTNTRAEFDYMWSSAQAALEKYRGENNNLIEVMESLQTEIYNTDNQISYLNSQINNLDVYIDNVSRSIDDVSNAISNQSNNVNSLASSWGNATANALAYKRALDDAANNSNTNNNGIPSNAKWTFDYYKNGKKYTAWATHNNYNDAAEAIISYIQKDTGQYRPDVYGGMKRYASGTRHTKNPLSLTQEDGLEALFVKNPNGSGSYTLTTPDSQVFDHQRTDELYNFSGNPKEYISKLAEKGLSPLSSSELNDFGLWNSPLDTMRFGETVFDNFVLNRNITNGSKDIYNNDNSANNQNITVNMPIQIQGNADSSVVQALNKYKTTFKKEMINELTRIGEKYRR